MTFTISINALRFEEATPLAAAASTGAEMYSRPTNMHGSVSFAGGAVEALAPEARLPVRLSLLSFEEDWNAPGMEAYDKM